MRQSPRFFRSIERTKIKLLTKRKDQHVYKIIEQPKKKDDESNYVVLENEGPVGAFNRAQRGVFNYLEVYAAYVAFVLLAGIFLYLIIYLS